MKSLFAAIVIATTIAAQAQLLQSFEGGNLLNVGPGTAGFSFTVGSEPLTIQTLGVWAAAPEGLFQSHAVGIWDVGQHLLAATIVTPTSTQVGEFFYSPITPLTLAPHESYILAAQYADVDFDQVTGNATGATLKGATLVDALLSSGTGFSYPDINVSGANLGFFGPNAGFEAVPEPAAMAITGCLLASLAFWRRMARPAHP